MSPTVPRRALLILLGAVALTTSTAPIGAGQRTGPQVDESAADPYADKVWPPPPDTARIRLETVISGRIDVEGESKVGRFLIGVSPQGPYDVLRKPHAVAFDPEGRVLVTDWQSGALLRFDLEGHRLDVLGTKGSLTLRRPMGLDVASDGTIFVADNGQAKVLAFRPDGKLVGAFGKAGELVNPTDVAVAPDGRAIFVADSKEHRIVVFDRASAEKLREFGRGGEGDGEFAFPTSLAFTGDGNLLVVDQINARVQLVTPAGEYLDQFGRRGVGFGEFVRPKDVAVDEVGFIYVVDNAFNNVQLFDADFSLLTFVGEGGVGPGQFAGASGIAVQGDRFAVVDQLGRRLQLFRFVVPKAAD